MSYDQGMSNQNDENPFVAEQQQAKNDIETQTTDNTSSNVFVSNDNSNSTSTTPRRDYCIQNSPYKKADLLFKDDAVKQTNYTYLIHIAIVAVLMSLITLLSCTQYNLLMLLHLGVLIFPYFGLIPHMAIYAVLTAVCGVLNVITIFLVGISGDECALMAVIVSLIALAINSGVIYFIFKFDPNTKQQFMDCCIATKNVCWYGGGTPPPSGDGDNATGATSNDTTSPPTSAKPNIPSRDYNNNDTTSGGAYA